MMMKSKLKEPILKNSKHLDDGALIKILIVDNLKDNLFALECLLRRDDVEIFKAGSGNEALDLMLSHEFALAIIDVHMPVISGLELAELMRGAKQTKNIPIIFVTATTKDMSLSFKGYASGAVDFLLKPLDTHAVKSKVNIFIELFRQKKELEELLAKLTKTQGELEQILQYREEMSQQQADELKIRKGQLKQGVDREREGADREKQGADREKIAEEQIHIQTKVMEFTVDGIFIIEAKQPDYPLVYVNRSFCTLTGYAKKELLGENYFLLHELHGNSRVIGEILETLKQGKFFHGEMLSFKKNGEKFWSSLRLSSVCNTSGTITHYVGIETDRTLMRQRDLEIEQQREELLHVTRVGKLAEFVSSLAHEISQPLTAILSYAQAAQRMFANKDPQLQEILQYIINDDQRATEVIRRLRALLKKSKPVFEPLDVNVLINDTVALIMTHITVRNKVIKFDLAKELPLIQGDRIQLQQVLLNLISNSLEAMDERSDSRELLVRTSRKNVDTIMVEVVDSGCGFPKENMDKLFVHFFTNKVDGLGMGLSISRSIVQSHGGQLEAKNNLDFGATFYFTLPINTKSD